MRHVCLVTVLLLLNNFTVEAKAKPANSFSFDVLDSRSTIYRDISKNLVLRVVKDDLGWNVQVTRKPITPKSSWNLLYHSLQWHGPYPSQVSAWHVTRRYFPNERTLDVFSYPYEVRIVLIDPVVEAEDFKSGRIKISWARKRSVTRGPR
jgi:hypothetical protein